MARGHLDRRRGALGPYGSNGVRAQGQTPTGALPSRRASISCGSRPLSAIGRGGSCRTSRPATSRCSRRAGRAHRGLPQRHRRCERGPAVRRQRQHGRAAADAREAARACAQLAGLGRDEAAVFTFDTRLDERAPFTCGLSTLPEAIDNGRTVRRDVAPRRDRRDGQARGRARGTPARGRRADRWLRQLEQAAAVGGVRDRERDRRAGLHLRHRAGDRQPGGRGRDESGRFGAGRSAGGARRRDRRTCVRGERAGTAQHRGAADHRRAAPSVPHRLRIERHAGLASARGPCPEQGPDPCGPGTGISRGNHARRRIRRSDHVAEIFRRGSRRGAGHRRLVGLRHQEVRADAGWRGEREGRLAGPRHRGDAGAHAPERGAHLRSRPEGGGCRAARRRRPDAAAAQPTSAAAANSRRHRGRHARPTRWTRPPGASSTRSC